jgi:hypothetical protein
MAKDDSDAVVPLNGSSSEYTIFLLKEAVSRASITFDADGNLTLQVKVPKGKIVEDTRDPRGSTTKIPKRVKLTVKLK